CGRMPPVLDVDRRFLDVRVGVEVGAHEVAVPRPVVLGVGRGMRSLMYAAFGDVAFEGRRLFVVQYIAGGGQLHDGVVVGEVVVGERLGVLCGVHGEVVLRAQLFDGLDPGGDRVVSEARRLREDQNTGLGLGLLRGGGEGEPTAAQSRTQRQRRGSCPPAASGRSTHPSGTTASLHWYLPLFPTVWDPVTVD